MNEKLESSLHSAKAVAEYYKNKAIEDEKEKNSCRLASEQVALLKEIRNANLRAEQERALRKPKNTNLVDVKPNFMGISVNLNEVWRRIKKWYLK